MSADTPTPTDVVFCDHCTRQLVTVARRLHCYNPDCLAYKPASLGDRLADAATSAVVSLFASQGLSLIGQARTLNELDQAADYIAAMYRVGILVDQDVLNSLTQAGHDRRLELMSADAAELPAE